MLDQQSLEERETFSLFAQVCRLPIQPDSIQKRNPDEPDILCQVSMEGPVAFEMGEVIDQELARQEANLELQSRLKNTFLNLPTNSPYAIGAKKV